jgi:hypothetical protein
MNGKISKPFRNDRSINETIFNDKLVNSKSYKIEAT